MNEIENNMLAWLGVASRRWDRRASRVKSSTTNGAGGHVGWIIGWNLKVFCTYMGWQSEVVFFFFCTVRTQPTHRQQWECGWTWTWKRTLHTFSVFCPNRENFKRVAACAHSCEQFPRKQDDALTLTPVGSGHGDGTSVKFLDCCDGRGRSRMRNWFRGLMSGSIYGYELFIKINFVIPAINPILPLTIRRYWNGRESNFYMKIYVMIAENNPKFDFQSLIISFRMTEPF